MSKKWVLWTIIGSDSCQDQVATAEHLICCCEVLITKRLPQLEKANVEPPDAVQLLSKNSMAFINAFGTQRED